MKKVSILIVLLISLISTGYSEEFWEIQSQENIGWLRDIQFINNEGWGVGLLGNTSGNPSIIVHSTDGGKNWYRQSPGTFQQLRALQFLNNKIGWAVGSGNTIIHTTDGGQKWLIDNTDGVLLYNSICFIDNITGWIVGNSPDETINIILKTTNGGNTWIQQDIEFPSSFLRKILFVDSLNGWIAGNYPSNIYRTTDGGNTWASINLNINEDIYSFHFINKNCGWACGGTYVRGVGSSSLILKTSDGGLNWFTQTKGKPYYVTDIQFIDKNHGWATAEFPPISCGVISNLITYTHNGGITWEEEFTNTNCFLSRIFIDKQLNSWVVGADNWANGIILHANLDTTSTTSVNKIKSVETDNEIEITPNPASDYISISIINGRVNPAVDKVEIYSIEGILMQSTSPQPSPFLERAIQLDVSGFVPGVYFVKIVDRVKRFVKM